MSFDKNGKRKSLIQEINELMLEHGGMSDERMRSLMAPVHPEDSVEGSLDADDYAAALRIRELALEYFWLDAIYEANLAQLKTALKRWMASCNIARWQRRKS